ncbi:MAG: THUMP domain-containing class I SAM-dependent RNA methyltransferase [Shimia sp.]
MEPPFDIFLVALPGLEGVLADEARTLGLAPAHAVPGGVEIAGGWAEVARANRHLRCASRVLLRVASFRALHLAQLDKRARRVGWEALIGVGGTFRVEVTCRKSRIYHAGAAAQRIARAIAEGTGAEGAANGVLVVKARIEDDLCTISVDTSGEGLHKRGLKPFVGKAPLRETMAAAFLRRMGFDGGQAVVDPMCGSGTFLLEAADIATGGVPGRARSFAFEGFPGVDRSLLAPLVAPSVVAPGPFIGFDRDQGAVAGAARNAEAAGLPARFACQPVSALAPPVDTPPGLVMVNPPYGARIGNRKLLFGLYGALGEVLRERFRDWQVGLVTSDSGLAKACGLPFEADPPVAHGGLKVRLYRARIA